MFWLTHNVQQVLPILLHLAKLHIRPHKEQTLKSEELQQAEFQKISGQVIQMWFPLSILH